MYIVSLALSLYLTGFGKRDICLTIRLNNPSVMNCKCTRRNDCNIQNLSCQSIQEIRSQFVKYKQTIKISKVLSVPIRVSNKMGISGSERVKWRSLFKFASICNLQTAVLLCSYPISIYIFGNKKVPHLLFLFSCSPNLIYYFINL